MKQRCHGISRILPGVLLGSLAACAGQSVAPEAVSADHDAQQEAASNARSSVMDVYRSIRRGKVDTSQSLLASDAFAVGPRAGDVYTTRTDVVLAVTSVFDAGDRHKLGSKGLVAEASVTGKSAWTLDRVDIDRQSYTAVSVLAEIDEIWYVVALHVGAMTPGSTEGELAPLAGGVVGGAEAVVELVRAGAQSPLVFLDQLSEHDKVTVVGPGKSDHLRGARKIKKKWTHKRRPQAPEPFTLLGGVRAGVTPDGGLAWVVANTRAGDGPLHRMMFVYERDGENWRLVAMQDSVPGPSTVAN